MLELIGRLVELGTRTSATTAPSTSTRAPTTATASCPATASRTCARATGSRRRRRQGQAVPRRLGAVEACRRRPRDDLGLAVGRRLPRLAHRVLGDVAAAARRGHRRPHRRHRPALPAPRGRAAQSNCAVGPGAEVVATGCTASTCCSRAARWPSRPATSCSSPTSSSAATTRSRCASRSCPRATASRPTCRGTRSPARPAPSTAGARPSPPGPSRRRRDRAGLGRRGARGVEDDLDTPRALQVLRRLEKATDVPDGAKFETFAWADRLLGLDLARLVGQAGPRGRAAGRGAGAARRPGRSAQGEGLRRVRPPARRAGRARGWPSRTPRAARSGRPSSPRPAGRAGPGR
jgi:hypothetical protein